MPFHRWKLSSVKLTAGNRAPIWDKNKIIFHCTWSFSRVNCCLVCPLCIVIKFLKGNKREISYWNTRKMVLEWLFFNLLTPKFQQSSLSAKEASVNWAKGSSCMGPWAKCPAHLLAEKKTLPPFKCKQSNTAAVCKRDWMEVLYYFPLQASNWKGEMPLPGKSADS